MAVVSVIIPTHNRSASLKQAIESVLAAEQDKHELEILVVDDGSTDDTPEVVKAFPVVYLRQSGGLGAAGARNVGLDAAHGDYITFLDDDDVWLPTKLTVQLRLLHEHPEYGMVLAQMWWTDSSLAARWGPYPKEIQQFQNGTDLLRFNPQVGTIVVRRAVVQKIRFDSSMRWLEDWDWALRVAQSYPVGYANVPVMLCHMLPRNTFQLRMFYRNAVIIFHRYTSAFNFSARLRLQPILWTWRGTYTSMYFEIARHLAQNRHYLQSAKAIAYAFRISPPHVTALLARSVWARLRRLPATFASQLLEG